MSGWPPREGSQFEQDLLRMADREPLVGPERAILASIAGATPCVLLEDDLICAARWGDAPLVGLILDEFKRRDALEAEP